jgi:hypothetical protein
MGSRFRLAGSGDAARREEMRLLAGKTSDRDRGDPGRNGGELKGRIVDGP